MPNRPTDRPASGQLEFELEPRFTTVQVAPDEYRTKVSFVEGAVWISTEEAARRAKRCARTIRRLVHSGEIEGRQLNPKRGKVEVNAKSLAEWLEAGRIL